MWQSSSALNRPGSNDITLSPSGHSKNNPTGIIWIILKGHTFTFDLTLKGVLETQEIMVCIKLAKYCNFTYHEY